MVRGMTGTPERPLTMVDEANADPKHALDLAAATGAIEGSALLSRVFDATGMTEHDLALRAQVADERVSQILAGEENLRLSTLARYLHAMGYRLTVSAINEADGTVIDTQRRVPARQRLQDGERHPSVATPGEIDEQERSQLDELWERASRHIKPGTPPLLDASAFYDTRPPRL